MNLNTDIALMQRCLQLADNGMGQVAPNPLVGAVVAHNGKIIGEGYHQRYGQAHAEANAIAAVANKLLLAQSTLYVSLEPCSHYGKQPPCSQLILQHRIPRVVVATTDPFPKVNGAGIEMLRQAGVEVRLGLLEAEAREQNRRFFTFHQKQRPYIILKWAQTLDGFIDSSRSADSPPEWITGATGQTLVHRWRTEEAAILVGANTVLRDNPQLTARCWPGSNPTRVVFDRDLSLPPTASIFNSSAPTLLLTTSKKQPIGYSAATKCLTLEGQEPLEEQIVAALYRQNLQSVIVEGGKQLLESFISRGLWDEARVFIGKRNFVSGIKAPTLHTYPTANFSCKAFMLKLFIN